jgi:protein phosphatase
MSEDYFVVIFTSKRSSNLEGYDEMDKRTYALGGGGPSHAEPQVRRVLLHPDDGLLLCSDGITKHLIDDEIGAILERERDPQRAVRELVRQADDRGGTDNSTAVVARCSWR